GHRVTPGHDERMTPRDGAGIVDRDRERVLGQERAGEGAERAASYRFDGHQSVCYHIDMSDNDTELMPGLVRLFKGLADPTRMRMIAAMVDRPRCGQALAAEVRVSPATVSHHLRVLSEAGLVRETRQPPYVFYQLDLERLQEAVRAVSSPRRVRELATSSAVD